VSGKKQRLDEYLITLNLFETRSRARAAILSGDVLVNGQRIDKAGFMISGNPEIRIKNTGPEYVSRGGTKLKGALESFDIDVSGCTCLDVGISTGGFTDCLLQSGASRVYGVDVGYGQLHWKLRSDDRVTLFERENFRYFDTSRISDEVDFAVVDVSFISLRLIIPRLVELLSQKARAVFLIKPQFEAKRSVRVIIIVSVMLAFLAGCAPSTQSVSEKISSQIVTKDRLPRIALVMGPGAALTFANAGILEELERAGLSPDIVVGSEMSALVALLYAEYGNSNRVQWVLSKFRASDYGKSKSSFFGGSNANFDSSAVVNFWKKHSKVRTFSGFREKRAGFTVTDLAQMKSKSVSSGGIANMLGAASGWPEAMKPVKFGGKTWVPGTASDPLPTALARKLGANIVIAVDVLGGSFQVKSGLEKVRNQKLRTHITSTRQLIAKSYSQADVVITPNLSGLNMFDFNTKRKCIVEGKRAAIARIDAIKSVRQNLLRRSR
jgi:TlyA family rRNA methyltransferase/putative hemolysin